MDYRSHQIQEGSIIEMIRKYYYNEKEFLAKEYSLYAQVGRIPFDKRPLGKSCLGYPGYSFTTTLLSCNQIVSQQNASQ